MRNFRPIVALSIDCPTTQSWPASRQSLRWAAACHRYDLPGLGLSLALKTYMDQLLISMSCNANWIFCAVGFVGETKSPSARRGAQAPSTLPTSQQQSQDLVKDVKQSVAELRLLVKDAVSHREKCCTVLSSALAVSLALEQVYPCLHTLTRTSMEDSHTFHVVSGQCYEAKCTDLVRCRGGESQYMPLLPDNADADLGCFGRCREDTLKQMSDVNSRPTFCFRASEQCLTVCCCTLKGYSTSSAAPQNMR